MPLDAVTLSALTAELRPQLVGAKIEKVQQPQRDMILLTVRSRDSGSRRLVLSGGPGSARIHFTEASFENPASPPMFCMLLRKHLVGSRIRAVVQPGRERLLILELDGYNELGDPVEKRLVLELIGRNTNLILVGSEGHVIDCLRRVDEAMSAQRQILPGLLYRQPPALTAPDFFSCGEETRREVLQTAARDGQPADKWLLRQFSGLSPLLCRELWYRAGEDWARLPAAMDAMAATVLAGEFTPCMLSQDKRPKDFSCLVIQQYGESMQLDTAPDFSTLLDQFYTGRDKAENMRRRASDLSRTVKTARERQARKLQNQMQELERTRDRETWKKYGELLTANLYHIPRGGESVTVQDYYLPDCPDVTIPLNPRKSPQQNAAAYFKEYTKAKTAEHYLTELIEKGKRDLEYLERVGDLLTRVQGEADIAELRRELVDTGFVKKPRQSGKKQREPEAKPLRFVSDSGFEILVGRSNAMNDRLTGQIARRNDLWLHTQKIHGSHVIVRTEDREVDAKTLEQAASLAAWFSQGRDAGKVPVDYTPVRNVKKPRGALPGGVIYTEFKTILAQPEEALAKRLAK